MKKIFPIVILSFVIAIFEYAGAEMPTELIEVPTAHVNEYGNFDLNLRVYEQGSVLTRLTVSALRNIDMGIYINVENATGNAAVKMTRPELLLKCRLFNSGEIMPALAIGYDSQGRGTYFREDDYIPYLGIYTEKNVYSEKERGLFAVLSKGEFYSGLGISIGINANDLEEFKLKDDVYMFIGISQRLSEEMYFIAEYDNIKDTNNDDKRLDMGLRYMPITGLTVEFAVKNIKHSYRDIDRILRIAYTGTY